MLFVETAEDNKSKFTLIHILYSTYHSHVTKFQLITTYHIPEQF
jgi:hypothetical protein